MSTKFLTYYESMEVWKYKEGVVEEWKICNRIWSGKEWPNDWTEGIVVLRVKKRKGKAVEDYGGMTLTQTAYKIYTSILAERLKEEVKRKEILPLNQIEFEKGIGTMDNIYVLNYLINRQVERGKEGTVIMFVDMKAAFDSVDRGKVVRAMREKVVREGLAKKCKKVLRKAKRRIRCERERGKGILDGERGKKGLSIEFLVCLRFYWQI